MALKTEIVAMRTRIEGSAAEGVDVKREPGGIVDIEFMVQYLALAWSGEHPALAEWTDNVRILDAASQAGLLTDDVAQGLKDAYLALRAERHRTALDIPDDDRARAVLTRFRAFVRTQWDAMLGQAAAS
ncbi:MAG: hypothetical protein HC809_06650 [Gammaproteobacteria bacterium]|nr:hypothetical protein [Gammaproteobacteria bacterium]